MKHQLLQLATVVEDELERNGYPPRYMQVHRRYVKMFIAYCSQRGINEFFEDVGEAFLSSEFGYPDNHLKGKMPSRMQSAVRAIRNLGDFQQFGLIKRSSRRRSKAPFPSEYEQLVYSFEKHLEIQELSKATIKNKTNIIGLFLYFAVNHSMCTIDSIIPKMMQKYFQSLAGYSNSHTRFTMQSLRQFFLFVHQNGYANTDLSVHIPAVKRIDEYHIPAVWTPEEITQLLSTVDRGNSAGKRDYAILLMAARLGLRRSDMENMKLESIHWETATIEIYQQKTGGKLSLPILDDVGEALIDYIKYARPDNGCPYLFLKLIPPFDQNISFGNIMKKYVNISGLQSAGRAHGLHSLRHTLASRLLEKKVPLPTISAVLGHADIHSTEDYLHIDIERLRNCALGVQGDLYE